MANAHHNTATTAVAPPPSRHRRTMPEAMEADQMFVLMTAQYRVSRNTRAQWFFNQVKKVAESSRKEKLVCARTGLPAATSR